MLRGCSFRAAPPKWSHCSRASLAEGSNLQGLPSALLSCPYPFTVPRTLLPRARIDSILARNRIFSRSRASLAQGSSRSPRAWIHQPVTRNTHTPIFYSFSSSVSLIFHHAPTPHAKHAHTPQGSPRSQGPKTSPPANGTTVEGGQLKMEGRGGEPDRLSICSVQFDWRACPTAAPTYAPQQVTCALLRRVCGRHGAVTWLAQAGCACWGGPGRRRASGAEGLGVRAARVCGGGGGVTSPVHEVCARRKGVWGGGSTAQRPAQKG